MLNVQLARRYAKAVFQIAQEQNKLVENLDGIANFTEFLDNPQIDVKAKKDLLKKVFESELSPVVYHLLLLLVDKHRVHVFDALEDQYRAFSYKERGIVVADVTTAQDITKKQQSQLKDKLESVTGKQIRFRLHKDPAIIGGIIVQMGDRRMDGSVRTRLRDLANGLLAH